MNNVDYDPAKLIAARNRLGLNKQQAANRIRNAEQGSDSAWMSIHRAENGISTSYKVLCRICDAYQIKVVEVLNLSAEDTA